MNEFTRKIITGNAQALMYAKSLLTDPALTFRINGVPFVVSLEVENCHQNGEAIVSEQLVVTSEGKKYISDNVAPGPWTWTLSGYLSGPDMLEPSNFFKPTVKFLTDILRKAFKNGLVATYKDIDCCFYKNVVIQSLDLDNQKDCKNKKPFTMTLKQIDVLQTSAGIISKLEALSSPDAGSTMGNTLPAGQTSSETDETWAFKKLKLGRFAS